MSTSYSNGTPITTAAININSLAANAINPYFEPYSGRGLNFKLVKAENGFILEINNNLYILNSIKKLGKQIEQILAVHLIKK